MPLSESYCLSILYSVQAKIVFFYLALDTKYEYICQV